MQRGSGVVGAVAALGGPSRGPPAAPAPGPAAPRLFRAAPGSNGAAAPGATTPIEMTYFNASSTLIRSSITSARGIIRKKPEVGFGVVGT